MAKILGICGVGIGALFLVACGSSSGGGGGGGAALSSGGAPGNPCNVATVNEGCYGANPAKRVQCTAGKWAEIAACAGNEHCAELADPAAPGTTKRVTQCEANVVATDVTSGGDTTAGGDTTVGSDTAASDVGGKDVIVVDVLGGKDTIPGEDAIGPADTSKPDTTKPDVCTPKCAAKQCGPDGCGGSCGKCGTNEACDVTGNCAPINPGTLQLGESCFGQTAQCVAGSKCAANASLTDWTCQKERTPGQTCGPGLGECVTGATCNFTDTTLKSMKCYAATFNGSPCSVPGYGDCSTGTSCVYTDNQGTATECVSNVGPGGSCDIVSLGLCDVGTSCIAAASSGYQCMADAPVGSACGKGIGGCEPGSDCVYDTSAATSATCQAAGQIGESCGDYGQPNTCVQWATCTPDSSSASTAFHCRPFAVLGGDCGYNIGLCAAFLSCAYADASQTTLTCLKAGAAGATCGNGVGGCLSGYACFLAATGDPTGSCLDECTTSNLYSNGTCDSCLKADPDCLQ